MATLTTWATWFTLTTVTTLTTWQPMTTLALWTAGLPWPTEPLWQPRLVKIFIKKINADFALFAWTSFLHHHDHLCCPLPCYHYGGLFQIIGAQLQHITWNHWLPNILGPKAIKDLGSYPGWLASRWSWWVRDDWRFYRNLNEIVWWLTLRVF